MDPGLEELEKGQGYSAVATPSQILDPEQVCMGQKQSKVHLVKKEASLPFSQKHKAFCLSGIACSPMQPVQEPQISKGSFACRAGHGGRE